MLCEIFLSIIPGVCPLISAYTLTPVSWPPARFSPTLLPIGVVMGLHGIQVGSKDPRVKGGPTMASGGARLRLWGVCLQYWKFVLFVTWKCSCVICVEGCRVTDRWDSPLPMDEQDQAGGERIFSCCHLKSEWKGIETLKLIKHKTSPTPAILHPSYSSFA